MVNTATNRVIPLCSGNFLQQSNEASAHYDGNTGSFHSVGYCNYNVGCPKSNNGKLKKENTLS